MKTQEISEKIEQRLIKEGVVDRDDIAARPFRRALAQAISNEVKVAWMQFEGAIQAERKAIKKDRSRELKFDHRAFDFLRVRGDNLGKFQFDSLHYEIAAYADEPLFQYPPFLGNMEERKKRSYAVASSFLSKSQSYDIMLLLQSFFYRARRLYPIPEDVPEICDRILKIRRASFFETRSSDEIEYFKNHKEAKEAFVTLLSSIVKRIGALFFGVPVDKAFVLQRSYEHLAICTIVHGKGKIISSSEFDYLYRVYLYCKDVLDYLERFSPVIFLFRGGNGRTRMHWPAIYNFVDRFFGKPPKETPSFYNKGKLDREIIDAMLKERDDRGILGEQEYPHISQKMKQMSTFDKHEVFADLAYKEGGLTKDTLSCLLWLFGYSIESSNSSKAFVEAKDFFFFIQVQDKKLIQQKLDALGLTIVAHGLFPAFPLL